MVVKASGASAGPDGWDGDELADWPPHVWVAIAASILLRCKAAGVTPDTWKEIRQVRIPPGEKIVPEGQPASATRPISVLCIIWLTVASATARTMRPWITTWLPELADGATRH